MPVAETIRHVPWTCRWGRFGGPVTPTANTKRGFLFWLCDYPQRPPGGPRILDRDQCSVCPFWERASETK